MNILGLAVSGFTILLGLFCLIAVGYLLLLLSAAAVARRRQDANRSTSSTSTKFTILVPAHDEELVIGAMLASLDRLDYPVEKRQILVIADNCTDDTAQIARQGGAAVLERFHQSERGKGYALDEAMRTLLPQADGPDAVVVIDADTFVASNFLKIMSGAIEEAMSLGDSRVALQGRYGVLNVEQGWRPALMAGAFDLFNHVKPMGREALGLSIGLKGNGMVFSRSLLETAPFSGASITEDIDYGLDLLLHHGVRVHYVPDALVKAQMPVSGAQAKSQRERWENGRFRLMRERAPSLLAASVLRRDIRLADAAVDLLLPPLAEIAGLLCCWAAVTTSGLRASLLKGSPGLYVGALGCGIVGFATYVLAGFKVADAPRDAYAALLKAPGYAVWKLMTLASKPLARLFGRRNASAKDANEWVRTERMTLPTTDGPTGQ